MHDYPDLRIITHHMGGMLPHFSERIKGFYDARSMFPRSNFKFTPDDPLVYFRRFYGDMVLNGSLHALECGYKFFGPKQIVFATDYPFGPRQGVRVDGGEPADAATGGPAAGREGNDREREPIGPDRAQIRPYQDRAPSGARSLTYCT